ncbi:hypothetical protein JMA_02120 [Jeotgalibacillus malaysiensis]|uniref:Uncharacterized protein n=1 Tax=Jeotgalibacillus malaysiensis TaxID=1508404 RepID=A0A0B5ANF5_9BACL|nr:hypothetical protein [Jeotgalibacillus malaysiensis]AJD89529.1 hypothetical protein JMA_02120 [Jeotgalibacillus malaysiensis]
MVIINYIIVCLLAAVPTIGVFWIMKRKSSKELEELEQRHKIEKV